MCFFRPKIVMPAPEDIPPTTPDPAPETETGGGTTGGGTTTTGTTTTTTVAPPPPAPPAPPPVFYGGGGTTTVQANNPVMQNVYDPTNPESGMAAEKGATIKKAQGTSQLRIDLDPVIANMAKETGLQINK